MTYESNTMARSSYWDRGWWGLVVFAACLLLAPSGLQAQQITGSFTGTVLDPTGAVVAGATISLTNQATEDSRNTVSNDRGYFTFAGVNPGTYTVSVSAQGFKSWKQTDLVMNAADSREIAGIRLAIGSSSDSVEVSAGNMPLVPTDNGERSALLSTEDIARLSLESRNVSELLKILPGVTTVANGIGNGSPVDFTNAGSTGSAVGNGLSPNGAPYRGGSAYILDGANIIDPGCNCNSLASINPDMTEEVKVQTSNFGADSADGPVIFNTISKSGGAQFHGQGYLYSRNGVLNSNLWENNHAGTPRTQDSYYYPGGNVGGPVRVPGTDFNKNNKLLFWAGYEYFKQNLGSATILQSYVPGADMRAGNFSLNNTNDTSALDSNAALCPGGFTAKATNWCNDLSGGYDANGNALQPGQKVPVDAGAKALMSLFPAANVNPLTNSGYNYYYAAGSQHNGWVWRGRVDYNLNDRNKFFVAYQEGRDSTTVPAHMYWNPGNAVPYPGGGLTNPTTSRVLTVNMLNIITPTMTNEFVGAWGYDNSPYKPDNVNASYSSTIAYPYGTAYNGSLVAPGIYSAGSQTFPDMSQPDLWAAGGGQYPLLKQTPSFTDNVTKVWKTHTFKFGLFTELVSNNQGSWYATNGVYSFASSVQADAINSAKIIGTNNPTANLVMGIASAFNQTSSAPLTNTAYRTTAAYVMDDWKVIPRLTVNVGFRFDHLGRWYDRAGNGMAVWLPGLYASDVADNAAWPYPGVRWHGVDPGIPNSGSPTRTAFTSPRLGFAYDVFATGKTVLRGGFGEYRWGDQAQDYDGPLTSAQLMKNYNSPSGNITFAEVGALGANSSSLGGASSSVNVADPNDYENSATYAYNFTISQQVPFRSLLEVAYVGNQTKNLLMGGESGAAGIGGSGFTNQNKIPVGGVFKADPVTGAAAPVDPEQTGNYNLTDYFPYYKGYGQNPITMYTHNGYSNYNALQAAWTKQTGRLAFNLNYTWSKALGIINSTVDAFTVHGNYGVLNIDRPHVVNTSYSYDLGRFYAGDSKLLGGAVNGWTISGTTTWQAGGNLQANDSQNLGMTIKDTVTGKNLTTLTYYGTNVGDIQPVTTCDPKSGLKSHELVNISCFAPPAVGQYGPRQYPYLGGPSYFNSDLTIYKTFHIGDKQKVEFRASAFNFLNHPLWKFSSSSIITPTFNTADKQAFVSTAASNLSSTQQLGTLDVKTGRRVGELSVKYSF